MKNAGSLLPIAGTKAHLELGCGTLDRDSQLAAAGHSIPGEPMAGCAEKAGRCGMFIRDPELRF